MSAVLYNQNSISFLRNMSTTIISDTFLMECVSEDLSETQREYQDKCRAEYDSYQKLIDDMVAERGGRNVFQQQHISVYEIPPSLPLSAIDSTKRNGNALDHGASSVNDKTRVYSNANATTNNTASQLFVPNSVSKAIDTAIASTNAVAVSKVTQNAESKTGKIRVRQLETKQNAMPISTMPTVPLNPRGIATQPRLTINPRTQVGFMLQQSQNATSIRKSRPLLLSPSPTVTASSARKEMIDIDLTADDTPTAAPAEPPQQTRTYPSLLVLARPTLRLKEMNNPVTNQERNNLDVEVKKIVGFDSKQLCEWLIQTGLIRSYMSCDVHSKDDTPITLNLALYSDGSKFPESGGYTWISECCPNKFVSVFTNSIFDESTRHPMIFMKLMYHWACQTPSNSIISWVEVDLLFLKQMFSNFRAVCTAAVWQNFGKFGGIGKKVEVGVISLGTTSQNGQVRQVKVEVLGILEPDTKLIRFRAVDPIQDLDQNKQLRFRQILSILPYWVHKDTKIYTDFTIDKFTLQSLGFRNVEQAHLSTVANPESNQKVMDYLKRIIPRMFQKTLSSLSKELIQSFLDELAWRERFGPISSRAYNALRVHIAEQTKIDSKMKLKDVLREIMINPFLDWSYDKWDRLKVMPKYGGVSAAANKAKVPIVRANVAPSKQTTNQAPSSQFIDGSNPTISPNSASALTRTPENYSSYKNTNNSNLYIPIGLQCPNNQQLVSLNNYYYGHLPPDQTIVSQIKRCKLSITCTECPETFNDNLKFALHLFKHGQGVSLATNICIYCTKVFDNKLDLDNHERNTHLPNSVRLICVICEIKFKSRADLITHMQYCHVPMEMPYRCVVCKYRTSGLTEFVHHFGQVHNNGEKLLCPICLKVNTIHSAGKNYTHNASNFISHIKYHFNESVNNMKCDRCALSFPSKLSLKDHKSKDHNSCLYLPGTQRCKGSMYDVLMPHPSVIPNIKNKKSTSHNIPPYYSVAFGSVLDFPQLPPKAVCSECNLLVGECSRHYSSYHCCTQCLYSTFCQEALLKHISFCHDRRKKLTASPGHSLYCSCGYESNVGTDMVKHLIECKKRTAYCSAQRANRANIERTTADFPQCVDLVDDNIDEAEGAANNWLQAFVPSVILEVPASSSGESSEKADKGSDEHSHVLNALGLARKELTNGTVEKPCRQDEETVSAVSNLITDHFDSQTAQIVSDHVADNMVEQLLECNLSSNKKLAENAAFEKLSTDRNSADELSIETRNAVDDLDSSEKAPSASANLSSDSNVNGKDGNCDSELLTSETECEVTDVDECVNNSSNIMSKVTVMKSNSLNSDSKNISQESAIECDGNNEINDNFSVITDNAMECEVPASEGDNVLEIDASGGLTSAIDSEMPLTNDVGDELDENLCSTKETIDKCEAHPKTDIRKSKDDTTSFEECDASSIGSNVDKTKRKDKQVTAMEVDEAT